MTQVSWFIFQSRQSDVTIGSLMKTLSVTVKDIIKHFNSLMFLQASEDVLEETPFSCRWWGQVFFQRSPFFGGGVI